MLIAVLNVFKLTTNDTRTMFNDLVLMSLLKILNMVSRNFSKLVLCF